MIETNISELVHTEFATEFRYAVYFANFEVHSEVLNKYNVRVGFNDDTIELEYVEPVDLACFKSLTDIKNNLNIKKGKCQLWLHALKSDQTKGRPLYFYFDNFEKISMSDFTSDGNNLIKTKVTIKYYNLGY